MSKQIYSTQFNNLKKIFLIILKLNKNAKPRFDFAFYATKNKSTKKLPKFN